MTAEKVSSLYVKTELKNRLKERAARDGVSMVQITEEIVTRFLEGSREAQLIDALKTVKRVIDSKPSALQGKLWLDENDYYSMTVSDFIESILNEGKEDERQ